MFTNTLNGSHLLRILTLGGFQNRDDRTVWGLASNGSDDGLIVRGEAIRAVILTIADNNSHHHSEPLSEHNQHRKHCRP